MVIRFHDLRLDSDDVPCKNVGSHWGMLESVPQDGYVQIIHFHGIFHWKTTSYWDTPRLRNHHMSHQTCSLLIGECRDTDLPNSDATHFHYPLGPWAPGKNTEEGTVWHDLWSVLLCPLRKWPTWPRTILSIVWWKERTRNFRVYIHMYI